MDSSFRPGLFAGKRVVITGGATGIGFAIAEGFAALDADVILVSRKEDHLKAAIAKLDSLGKGTPSYQIADVRDAVVVEKAAKAVGAVDVLVNGAAGNFPVPFSAMSQNAWTTVIDIVLNGTANTTRAFGSRMLDGKGGCIINIVAGYAWTGAPGVAHSGAAKAGVLNLTKTLAVEWAPKVRVNAVSPGPIEGTEGMKRLADDLGLRPALIKGIPLQRMGEGREIADACLFLASQAGSYVTGACLTVDGGMDAKGPFGDLLTG